jgi:hypothetical protein
MMNRIRLWRSTLLLAVPLLALQASAVWGQETTLVVEVTGESSGGKESTIAQIEEQAKQAALQQAVERAGVYLESTTEVDMAVVSKDEIQSWAQGFVKVLEVLENRTDFDPKLKAFRCEMRLKVEVRTQDMSELLKRVEQDRAEQAAAKQALAFEFSFLAQRRMADGTWAEVRVKDGSVLRSGDQFQVSVRADRDCHAYVINQDASGKVYVLFPHEQAISNRLEGGREYILPDRDLFYELDEVVGLETFYLAASPTPMADLEWIVEQTQKLGENTSGMVAMLDGTLRTRSGGTRGAKVAARKTTGRLTSGKTVEKVTEMIEGKGALVQVVTVDHR